MSSEISTAERAAINAAIEAGKVRTIPQGQSTFVYPVWKPETNALVVPDGVVSWKRQRKNSFDAKNRFKPQPCPLVAERRAKVMEMAQAGLSTKDAADALGVTMTTIWSDAKLVGAKFIHRTAAGVTKRIEDRREKVAALVGEGMKPKAISQALGIPHETIRKDLRALRKAAA